MLTTIEKQKQRRQRIRDFHKKWTPATLFYLSLIIALSIHTNEYTFFFLPGSLILSRWLVGWMQAGDEFHAMDFGSFISFYGLLIFMPWMGFGLIASGYVLQGIIALALTILPIVTITILFLKDHYQPRKRA